VTLIPNGVDIDYFTRMQPRPADLPSSPVAVYVGTLHDDRIDVELVVELAQARPELSIALVGPDALSARCRRALMTCHNVILLGSRPYVSVPGYLQHADVVIIPHLKTSFTESLDPIKAYECLVVGCPTVATDVAGFRDLGNGVTAVPRGDFVARTAKVLELPVHEDRRSPIQHAAMTWHERCSAFEATLARASRARKS